MTTEAIFRDKNGAKLMPDQIVEVYGYVPVTREEFEEVAKQVAEIHAFLSGIASALKSPMFSAMLPPQLRSMLP